MILVFKKGLEYKGSMGGKPTDVDANIFPMMSLPLDAEGTESDLNDFQWWAYTDKWKKWLEANPREWQAESSENNFDKAEELLESMVTSKNPISDYVQHQAKRVWEGKSLTKFSDYVEILEANEYAGSQDGVKKFIKLGFAIEKLISGGVLKDNLKMEDLTEGEEYAIVVDPLTEDESPLPEGRQALRIKKIGESAGIILADMDYSIPIGEVTDTKTYMNKIEEYAKDVGIGLASGVGLYAIVNAAGSLVLGWQLLKGVRGVYKNLGRAKRVHGALQKAGALKRASTGTWNAVKGFASKAFKGRGLSAVANASRVTLPSGAFVEGGIAYSTRATGHVALKGAAAQSTKAAARRIAAQGGARAAAAVAGRAGAGAAASGVLAAEASNPVGWIIAAASVIGSGVNQVWNWLSDKQAPRYSEVDDFAYGTFSPKNIPVGKSITVCWTSDGGGGTMGFLVDLITFSKDDTRTTMEIVKIGERDGRSLFIILQVNSESFEKIMSDNDLIILSFDNGEKFERGTFDNDDLEFKTIIIPDMTENTIGTSLVGYCSWDEMQDAYRESPDSPIFVPENAKQKYEFHFEDNDGNAVNVTGSLISEDKLNSGYINDLIPIPGEGQLAESTTSPNLGYDHLLNESTVLSFADFSSSLVGASVNEEDETEKNNTEEEVKTPEAEEEVGNENPDGNSYADELEATISRQTQPVKPPGGYSQIPIVAYEVSSISFVDPNVRKSLSKFSYFLVSEESIAPSQNEPVLVESASEDAINDPRYGLQTYVPKKEEEVDDIEDDVVDIKDIEKEEKDDDPDTVFTTRDDVTIKSKSGSLTIKDKKIKDGINIFDEFATPALKKDLNIDDWETVTKVKVRYDGEGEPTKVVLVNRYTEDGSKRRVVRKGEQGFKSALDFARRAEEGISFSG